MKKFLLVCMTLFACCMFFGCGKPEPSSNEYILLSVATGADGMINQSLHFSVGSNKLKASGLDALEIEQFKTRLAEKINIFHDEFFLSYLLKYVNNPAPQFQIGKALIITQPTYTPQTDTIGFNMLFSSQEAWNFYHSSSGQQESNSPVKSDGFIISVRQSAQFPFSAKQGDLTVAQRYIFAYQSALEGARVDYQPDLIYDYATPVRQIKSDSNFAFKDQLYHHIWSKKPDQIQDAKITLYTSAPNAPLWYVCLLLVTVFGLSIAIIAIKCHNKSHK